MATGTMPGRNGGTLITGSDPRARSVRSRLRELAGEGLREGIKQALDILRDKDEDGEPKHSNRDRMEAADFLRRCYGLDARKKATAGRRRITLAVVGRTPSEAAAEIAASQASADEGPRALPAGNPAPE